MKIKRISAVVICSLLLFASVLSVSAEKHPSRTEKTDEIKLIKSAKWQDDRARVELTIQNLGDIEEPNDDIDILFLVDNSRSMTADCNTTDHISYASYRLGDSEHKWNLSLFDLEIKPLIESEITDPEGKITVAADGSWNIDPELTIALSEPGWIAFPAISQIRGNSNFEPLGKNRDSSWYVADLNTVVHGWKAQTLHYQVKPDNSLERLYITSTTSGVTYLGLSGSYPYEMYTDGSCLSNLQANFEAISDFAENLYKISPDSHIAISTFNSYARRHASNVFTDYAKVSDIDKLIDAYKSAVDTMLYTNFVGYTNYEAGFRSTLKTINDNRYMDGSSHQDCEHRQLVVFFTDGWPNTRCNNGDMTTQVNANFPIPYDYAKPIINEIKSRDIEMYVATAGINTNEGGDIDDIEKMLSEIATDKEYRFKVEDYGNGQSVFSRMYEDILDSIVLHKHVVLGDIIDNRYFEVDRELLEKNENHYYYPGHAMLTIKNKEIDNVPVQIVEFSITIEDSDTEMVEVKIPLKLLEEFEVDNYDGYLPLNYDPIGRGGGAYVRYRNKNKEDIIVETSKVWLRGKDPSSENTDGSNDHQTPPVTGDSSGLHLVYLFLVIGTATLIGAVTKPKRKPEN